MGQVVPGGTVSVLYQAVAAAAQAAITPYRSLAGCEGSVQGAMGS